MLFLNICKIQHIINLFFTKKAYLCSAVLKKAVTY